MKTPGNAINSGAITPASAGAAVGGGGADSPARGAGIVLGLLGVLGFSFSLPATRLAVGDLDPWFVTFSRAVAAAALAALYLLAVRAPLPTRAQWRRLTLVAGGAVVGFPLLTGLALVTSESQHGAVFVALLPAATALAAVARAGERPGALFWVAALAGLLVVVIFTVAGSGGAVTAADLFLLGAVAVCAVAYAEGGVLSRELGGARTICWALVLSLPATLPVAAVTAATSSLQAAPAAWLGLAYVSLVSMFLAFFAWYAGLARGGVARVGQVQLLQPLLTVSWSALVLGERVGPGTVLAATGVLAAVVVTQRARVRTLPAPAPPRAPGRRPGGSAFAASDCHAATRSRPAESTSGTSRRAEAAPSSKA